MLNVESATWSSVRRPLGRVRRRFLDAQAVLSYRRNLSACAREMLDEGSQDGLVSRPIFLLSDMRTGSSLVSLSMGDLEPVTSIGEAFNSGHHPIMRGCRTQSAMWRFVREVVEEALTEFVLINIHARELTFRSTTAAEFCAVDESAPVIHLFRNDLLAQFVSMEQARRSEVWEVQAGCQTPGHTSSGHVDLIQVDVSQFAAFAEDRRRWFNDCARLADTRHPFVRLTYEEIAADPRRAIERAANVIGQTGLRRLSGWLVMA